MARKNKTGVDYFPLDTRLNEKWDMLEAEHGVYGFGIAVKLFQMIYANGYFIEWNKRTQLVFKKRNNVDINQVNVIINSAIEWGLFNKTMYKTHQVLTSKGIQSQFLEITKRRNLVEIVAEYWLFNIYPKNADINHINVNINSKNADKKTQTETETETESKGINPINVNKNEIGESNPDNQPDSPFSDPPEMSFDDFIQIWNTVHGEQERADLLGEYCRGTFTEDSGYVRLVNFLNEKSGDIKSNAVSYCRAVKVAWDKGNIHYALKPKNFVKIWNSKPEDEILPGSVEWFRIQKNRAKRFNNGKGVEKYEKECLQKHGVAI